MTLPNIPLFLQRRQKELPVLLRFRDLKEAGIVNNWVTLKRWIKQQGFPAGKQLGPNTRVWEGEAVADWLAGRPEAGLDLIDNDEE